MDIRLCALFVLINQITFHFSHVGNVYVLLYVNPALSHWCLPLFPWPFNLESPRCGWNRRKANILSLQILTVPGNEGVRPLLLVYDLRHAFFFSFFFFLLAGGLFAAFPVSFLGVIVVCIPYLLPVLCIITVVKVSSVPESCRPLEPLCTTAATSVVRPSMHLYGQSVGLFAAGHVSAIPWHGM